MSDDMFTIEVPKPGAPLKEARIASDNRDRLAARQEPRLLTAQQIKRLKRQREKMIQALSETDYPVLRERLAQMRAVHQEIVREYRNTPDVPDCRDQRAALRTEGAAQQRKIRTIELKHRDLLAVENRVKRINRQLEDHAAAVRRQQKMEHLRAEQADEAYEWHDKVVNRFTQLGYSYERTTRKGKTRVDRVRIERLVVTEDEVQLKIAASARRLGGWVDLLPRGVRVADLVDDRMVSELETTLQRQVTTHLTPLNGAWIVIHRPAAANSVLNYLTLAQVNAKRDPNVHERFPLALGVSSGRQIEYVYLDRQPHMLVGGETGGGKSNFSNSIICQLIGHYTPAELQFVLIDLKEEAEFRPYRQLPHLMLPVVGTLDGAVATLARLEVMRAERMATIANADCSDIVEYNRKVADADRLPRVVCMIDEYADVLSDKHLGNEVERFVTSLTQKARAAGINLIISTQNPYVSIIPGHIKGNMGARVAFAMSDPSNSRTILSTGEAAALPRIPGRAVFKAGMDKREIQAPHCRPEDRAAAIETAMQHAPVEMDAPPLPEDHSSAALVKRFDINELIRVSIEDLDGNLGARPIYEAIKHEYGTVSRGDVEKMIKPIVEDGAVIYEGQLYPLRKHGRGWAVDMENAEPIHESEAA